MLIWWSQTQTHKKKDKPQTAVEPSASALGASTAVEQETLTDSMTDARICNRFGMAGCHERPYWQSWKPKKRNASGAIIGSWSVRWTLMTVPATPNKGLLLPLWIIHPAAIEVFVSFLCKCLTSSDKRAIYNIKHFMCIIFVTQYYYSNKYLWQVLRKYRHLNVAYKEKYEQQHVTIMLDSSSRYNICK